MVIQPDDRTEEQRERDEAVVAEPPLDAPSLPPGARPAPVEEHLQRLRPPIAVAGVVENGLVRPLDRSVRLPEHAHVIVVTRETPGRLDHDG